MKRLGLLLALAGCAHAPIARPRGDSLPTLDVASPSAGSIQHAPEVEVRGSLRTSDGRGWVWVDGTPAEVHDGTWVAHRVPIGEGQIELGVVLTDGAGRKTSVRVPLVVETHDRPFSDRLCVADRCLRYETRGTPVRDEKGLVTNAIVVVSAYGFGEQLDSLWPDLVGPQRALDSRTRWIVGVASDPGVPLERLMESLALARTTPLVGASTYGAETVLRLVAREPTWTGPVVICGGHDRAWDEPVVRAVRRALDAPDAWRRVVELMVPATYTLRYLADVRHAVEHGLVEESRGQGLAKALIELQLAHPASMDELRSRLETTDGLGKAPLVFTGLAGRRITLIVNTQDRLVSAARVRALGDRLRAAGATVTLATLDDELGHSAYFRHAPPALEQALVEGTRP